MNKPHEIHFKIDKTPHAIMADQNPVTGAYLRDLPPAVGPEYDLWLRGQGQEDDSIVEPATKVELTEGMHFYTAKKDIAPGGRA